jgi:hypothetical protein
MVENIKPRLLITNLDQVWTKYQKFRKLCKSHPQKYKKYGKSGEFSIEILNFVFFAFLRQEQAGGRRH